MQNAYSGLAAIYDRLMKDIPYDKWAGFIISKAKLSKTAQVADVACGTGNIALRLAQQGCSVIALDNSEQMLAIAAEKARKMGVRAVFVKQELAELSLHKKVDCITCACDGVNYLTTKKELNDFFQRAYNTLKPGGMLVFDISSHYKLKTLMDGNLFFEDLEDITYFWQNSFNDETACLNMELVFFLRSGNGLYKRFDEQHVQKAHKVEDLIKALENCGFKDIKTYDDYSNSAAGETSLRITFTAVKDTEAK